MGLCCIKCNLYDKIGQRRGDRMKLYRTKVLYAIKIKLVIIQIRQLEVKMLILTVRAATTKITQINIVKQKIRIMK